MNPTILILGHSSMIGQNFTQVISDSFQIFGTYHKSNMHQSDVQLDILSEKSLEHAFQISKPDVVLNLCAIYNNLDFCEKNKDLVLKVNGESLSYVSKFANKYDAHLFQLSTDYVFDGNSGNYLESDIPNPINTYGRSKYLAEKIINEKAKKFTIVRTSMVYGRNKIKPTLPEWIIKSSQKGETLKLINDQFMTPTYLGNFCLMLKEVIDRNISGIIHLAGRDKTSRYEFALKLFSIFGYNKKILVPISRTEFEFSKTMPRDSSLNTDMANKLLNEKPERLEESIKKFHSKFSNTI